jgi:hypothetical protein
MFTSLPNVADIPEIEHKWYTACLDEELWTDNFLDELRKTRHA